MSRNLEEVHGRLQALKRLKRLNEDVFQISRRSGVNIEETITKEIARIPSAVSGSTPADQEFHSYMYDYLCDPNWGVVVAAGEGVEGQVFRSISRRYYRIYSSITLASAHFNTNSGLDGRTVGFVGSHFVIGPETWGDSSLGPIDIYQLGSRNNDDTPPQIEGDISMSSFNPTTRLTLDACRIIGARLDLGRGQIEMNSHSEIRDCFVDHDTVDEAFGLGSIRIDDGDGRITNCRFREQSGTWAIEISGSQVDAIISQNVFTDAGIVFSGSGFVPQCRVIIGNNQFKTSSTGIMLGGGQNNVGDVISIVGNNFNAINGPNISAKASTNQSGVTISGNSFYCTGSADDAIDFSPHTSGTMRNFVIANNTFITVNPLASQAIIGNADIEQSLIIGNVFKGFQPGNEIVDWDLGSGNEAMHNVSERSGVKQDLQDIGAPVGHITYREFRARAAPGTDVSVGDGQDYHHTADVAETIHAIYLDADTAPTGATLICEIEVGDTDDLDTVAVWTLNDTITLAIGAQSIKEIAFTDDALPANRLMRFNITQVGSTEPGEDVRCIVASY